MGMQANGGIISGLRDGHIICKIPFLKNAISTEMEVVLLLEFSVLSRLCFYAFLL